MADKCVQCLW
jgi:vesicle coat complex subunit